MNAFRPTDDCGDTILLAMTQHLWVAMYFGPHRAKIEKAFGCNMVPTPFTSNTPVERVVAEAEWYEAGGFANSKCWRREVRGVWQYYIRTD